MHTLVLTITIPLLMSNRTDLGADGANPTQLSKATGVPEPTIHRIISGDSKDPRRSNVEKIASFFGLSYSQIYDVDFVKDFVSGGVPERQSPYHSVSDFESELQELEERFKSMSPGERLETQQLLLRIQRKEFNSD